jgi:hypothetical protein
MLDNYPEGRPDDDLPPMVYEPTPVDFLEDGDALAPVDQERPPVAALPPNEYDLRPAPEAAVQPPSEPEDAPPADDSTRTHRQAARVASPEAPAPTPSAESSGAGNGAGDDDTNIPSNEELDDEKPESHEPGGSETKEAKEPENSDPEDQTPEAPNAREDAAQETAEMRESVKESVAQVKSALSRYENSTMSEYSLAALATAVMLTEGPEPAREFAESTIEALDMPPAKAFVAWNTLYAAGDEEALPKARQAIGLASEQLTFLEAIDVVELHGQHSTERLVALVESGDTENTALARDMVKNVDPKYSPALFAKLYKAGDDESLDLAIEAAKEAKQYSQRIGDRYYLASEKALSGAAEVAIQKEKHGDALKLMQNIDDEFTKAELHVQLFGAGRAESLQEALGYLQQASGYEAESLVRELAEAGYQPALEAVKQRVEACTEAKKNQFGHRNTTTSNVDIFDELEDLAILHNAGVEGAGQQMVERIGADKEPIFYLRYLRQAGLHEEAAALAAALYEADPSDLHAEELMYARFDLELWHNVFDHYLYATRNIYRAAQHVEMLARKAVDNAAE